MWIIYILIVLLVSLFVLNFIAPKTYVVERSAKISRPVSEVYNYLKYLKNQDEWSPWMKKDPTMKRTTTGVDASPGYISAWEGNKAVGSGEQELVRLVDDELVESQLRFLKPFKSTSDAHIRVEPVDDNATKVTWGFSGSSVFPMNIMMLFTSMDKMVGKDFEEGLGNLKQRLEG